MPTADNGSRATQRDVAARWSPAIAAAGWTPIADTLLDAYRKLDPPMTNMELLLVIHLMRFKWDANAPFPGFKTLAKKMGVTATSVRNHARTLELKGYLRRVKRVGATNRFDLTPLFAALEKYLLERPKAPARAEDRDESF